MMAFPVATPLRPIRWEEYYASWGSVDGAYSPSRLLEVLKRWLPIAPALRVLELGCAPGRWLDWIARHRAHAETHGIDLSAAGLALTRRLSANTICVRASAVDLPYGAAAFDCVFSAGLLEHFEDCRPILRESLRVLRPGGVAIVTIPNLAAGSLQGWHMRMFQRELFEGHRPLTLVELEREMRETGFEVLHGEYNGLFVPHAQRLIARLGLSPVARLFEGPRTAASLVVVGRRSG